MTRPEDSPSATEEPGPPASVTGLRKLVLIEAAVPRPPRRVRWLLLASTLTLGLGLSVAVREVAKTERTLAAEGAKAVRVVMYEVTSGADFRVPIEPDTDVLRVVVHAMRRGTLPPGDHAARLSVGLHGTVAARDENLVIRCPGSTGRVTPEDQGLMVGDPLGLNIDVKGMGTGDVTLSLAAIDAADGVLVRVYRREAVHAFDSIRREATIDDAKRERLAMRAGELDWLDLEPSEQIALIGARWRKLGALGDSSVATRVVHLAPPLSSRPTADDVPVGTVTLRPNERASLVTRGPTTIVARATGLPSAQLVADVRADDGSTRRVEGRGEVRIDTEAGRVAGIELTTDEPHAIAIFASDPARVAMPETVRYWRATPERAAFIAAGAQPIALRVSARRPVQRIGADEVSFAVKVAISTGASSPAVTTRTITTKRSEVDRYEGRDPELSPSERAIFYLLVPPHGFAELAPLDGAVDLHFAELDPRAAPEPALAHAEQPRAHEIGGAGWEGWVTRRPSNAEAFPPGAQTGIRIAHRLVFSEVRKPEPSRIHVVRSPGPTFRRDGALFARADAALTFDMPSEGPIILPIRIFSSVPIAVVARVDAAKARGATTGVFARITLPRTLTVDGELRSALVLGDDLKPGRYVLTLSTTPNADVWVHLPWKRPADAPGTRWVTGDFEQ